MNYTKPEIALLGDAVRVIENISKPPGTVFDNGVYDLHPAYDLDE